MTSTSRPALQRYESLDGFRCYASIGIVLMHILTNLPALPAQNFLFTRIIPWFTEFTLLFMIISGFSLHCGYFDRFRKGLITPATFYSKRIARLFPFFALMCLLDFIASMSLNSLYELYADLTLCFGLIPDMEINIIGVGWFIGVVMVFYMIYPFVVFLQSTRTRAIITMILFIGLVLVAYNCATHPDMIGRRQIFYVLPLFLSGGLIYHFRNEISGFVSRHNFICGVLALAASVLPFVFDCSTTKAILLVNLTVFSIWLAFAIGSRCLLLNNRIVRYISGISLEIYLCHMVFFRIFERISPFGRHLNDMLTYYIMAVLVVLTCAIIFSHIVKYKIFPYIGNLKAFQKLNRLLQS